jgi:hypothetical protein
MDKISNNYSLEEFKLNNIFDTNSDSTSILDHYSNSNIDQDSDISESDTKLELDACSESDVSESDVSESDNTKLDSDSDNICEIILKSKMCEINQVENSIDLEESEELCSEDSLKSYDSFDTKDENILKKEIIKTRLLLLKQKNEKENKKINILKNKEYNDLLIEMLEEKRNSKENKTKECIKIKSKEDKQQYKKEIVTKIIIDNDDDYLHNHKFF